MGGAGFDGAVLGSAGARGGRAAVAGDTSPGVGQHATERLAELAVEDAVDDRVHRAVDVAEPREDGEDERRDAAGTAQRADQIHREERTPRQQEHSHDDAERDRRFVVGHLLAQRTDNPVPFVVGDATNSRLRLGAK